MSAPVAATPGSSTDGLGSASAAAARVAALQRMIAEVEGGTAPPSSSFSTQLASASAVAGSPVAGASTVGAEPLAGAPVSGAPALGGSTLNPSVPYAAQIEAAASRYGLDPALLAGLIKAESGFDPNAGSPAGAQGLTQLMPETANSLGVTNPLDPEQAIEGGARLLHEHLEKFDGNAELALAAYNAGPGAVEQYGGIPPYPETQSYVKKVLAYAAEFGCGAGAGGYGG
ncbi:MAG TPA: lytic transglycosylase domain-containing protein [Solirubrobacterales bacterium]|nr:lytic transglycosylase domain-containing protein [Solirubrobacterales bacterium]